MPRELKGGEGGDHSRRSSNKTAGMKPNESMAATCYAVEERRKGRHEEDERKEERKGLMRS